jgi:hypothetical protein
MAKADAQIVDENSESKKMPPGTNIPKGYQEFSDDLTGFYDWEVGSGPIHFIPGEVRLSDSKADDTKCSALCIGELVDNCDSIVTKDGEVVKGRKGDQVGVWLKPGMRGLANLAGVPVYMYQEGEVDTGKPNAMYLFKCFAKGKARKLMVTEDFRRTSKDGKLPFSMYFATASSDGGL